MMLDEATQARHRLTHMPYANWCKECIEHRARPDRQERTDGVKRGSIPEVSFDCCYTRPRGSETKSARAVCWLVAIDSQTGFIHVVPSGSKGQFPLTVQELMKCSQLLGYSAIAYKSDYEPVIRQILKMLINARHSLGLTTRLVNSKLGDIHFCQKMCRQDLVSRLDQIMRFGLGQQDMPVGCLTDFSQPKVQLPMSLSMARGIW